MREQTGIAIIEKALRQGDKDALDAMGISEIMYTGMFAQGASVGHLVGSGISDFKAKAKNLWNKLLGGSE